MAAKSQPWKAFPREQPSVAGRKYMTDVDGTALVDGNFQPPDFDPPMFGVCQKEQIKPRAQPWKAHWSPEEHAVNKGHLQYLCDKDGAALVDGLPGHDGTFSDLYCQKEQTKPRAQPWKAHLPAEQQVVDGEQRFHYLSDNEGAALVDGAGSGPGSGAPGFGGGDGGFIDLCC